MSIAEAEDKRVPRTPTQKRSRERFELILDCAENMLGHSRPDELSIHSLAEQLGMPAKSVYRLFPSPAALGHALIERYQKLLLAVSMQSDYSHCTTWQEAIKHGIKLAIEFYEEHPYAMDLILGANASGEGIAINKGTTVQMAQFTANGFHAAGVVSSPDIVQRPLEIMMNMVDAIWSQSIHHHGTITPYYHNESARVAIHYLELYIPRYTG